MKHISMFIIAIFLGGVPANAAPDNLKVEGYMPWKQDGVETSFATTDSTLDAALEANPNTLIIPRFGVTWAPAWWVEKNLGERADCATRVAAAWWMNIVGEGWYQGDDLWRFLDRLQKDYQESLASVEPYHAEIVGLPWPRSA